ncbi:MAG: DUF4198 domain-containing protein [Candidatus Krumholzibacteriota bacterium]|nr:DUF4198 domain-containing protein [Candidatus Krumholzibacteriota bacterium]
MRNILLIICVVAAVVPGSAAAHEHWFVLDEFYPAEGDTTAFSICTGHNFPSSSMALKDNVIDRSYYIRPGPGKAEVLESVIGERSRTGVFIPEAPGVHILVFVLKRPKAEEPSFEAKAITVAGGGTDDSERYIIGRGLEIVPAVPVTALRKGSDLEVSMILDGAPVEGEIVLTSKNGKSIYRRTGIGDPAVLPLTCSGICMISGSYGGRECSLVFSVPDKKGKE